MDFGSDLLTIRASKDMHIQMVLSTHLSPSEHLNGSNNPFGVGQTCGHGPTRHKSEKTFRSDPAANRVMKKRFLCGIKQINSRVSALFGPHQHTVA